jgi:hypothetical protein
MDLRSRISMARDQFVHHTISEPRLIAAWLSGYYNAKRNNRVIDLQSLEERMSKVTNYLPVPDQLAARVPQTKDYQYAATHDRVLLVATSRIVAEVFAGPNVPAGEGRRGP